MYYIILQLNTSKLSLFITNKQSRRESFLVPCMNKYIDLTRSLTTCITRRFLYKSIEHILDARQQQQRIPLQMINLQQMRGNGALRPLRVNKVLAELDRSPSIISLMLLGCGVISHRYIEGESSILNRERRKIMN